MSGQGRALAAVQQAADHGLLPVEVVAVVTDRPSPIEGAAAMRGVPCYRVLPDGRPYAPALLDALVRHDAEWMGLTFNRILSDEVIARMSGRIFNVHLSLLPMFPGFGAIPRALSSGMRLTAATVHLVDGRADGGTILGQAAVPVAATDTRAALGRRLFENMLPLLLQVVRGIGTGDLTYAGGRLDWAQADRAPDGPSHVFPTVDADLSAFARGFLDTLPTD